MENPDLKAIHQYCTHNKKLLLEGKKCGCFYCLEIFDPKEIETWIDSDDTAICPHCTIDSVLPENCGFEINKKLLEDMKKVWF